MFSFNTFAIIPKIFNALFIKNKFTFHKQAEKIKISSTCDKRNFIDEKLTCKWEII